MCEVTFQPMFDVTHIGSSSVWCCTCLEFQAKFDVAHVGSSLCIVNFINVTRLKFSGIIVDMEME